MDEDNRKLFKRVLRRLIQRLTYDEIGDCRLDNKLFIGVTEDESKVLEYYMKKENVLQNPYNLRLNLIFYKK
jgi:hypothetical protein